MNITLERCQRPLGGVSAQVVLKTQVEANGLRKKVTSSKPQDVEIYHGPSSEVIRTQEQGKDKSR